MPHYAVRITHSFEKCKAAVSLWATRCQKIVAYEHVGETTGKIHIHLALYGTVVDKKQLRNVAATTGLDVAGNQNCSFKLWVPHVDPIEDVYLRYMSKGNLWPHYHTVYTDEQIKGWTGNWVEPQHYDKETTWQGISKDFRKVFTMPTVKVSEDWLKSDSAAPPPDPRFHILASAAHKFCRAKGGGDWCPQYTNWMKCCIKSLAWEYNIQIPKDYKYD